MQILKIGYNTNIKNYVINPFKCNNKENNQNIKYQSYAQYNIPFMANYVSYRVSKEMPRFYNFTKDIMPTTVKDFIESLPDKFLLKPLEAHKAAFKNLSIAKNISQIKQELFPKEALFLSLMSIAQTDDNDGLLGIYKDFKEIYPEGILKSGEDFTVYLLKKYFMEAKLTYEVNKDLENDLNDDVKAEFKRRCPNSDYIQSKTLRALGITLPDTAYINVLKFTRDGYSDSFGLKITESLQRKLENMTEEEKERQLYAKNPTREHWWNSLTREEKLDLIASLENEQEDVYKNYKEYEKINKENVKKQKTSLPEFYEKEKKEKSSVSKLNDKDLFTIWMKKNLEKFYAALSEEELKLVKLKRSKAQAQRWQEMSPEARNEYINSLRAGMEPLQYAMIDAWNHSRILIRALAEFLREQQVYKPIDMLYSNSEFKGLQSKIMIEFWASHKELADDFGKAVKYSHNKVEDAIKNGEFEALKKDIELERDRRKAILKKEYDEEVAEVKQKEENKIKEKESGLPLDELQYRKEFAEIYKHSIDKYNILPPAYTKGMAEIILDRFPKDIIIKYGNALKNKEPIPQDVMEVLTQEQKKNNSPKAERLQRTLEAAIASELCSKGAAWSMFQMKIDALLPLLEHRYADTKVPRNQKVNKHNILKLFNQYNRDLTDEEANTLANTYFSSKKESLTQEENELFENYLNSYGRSLYILFSDKSAYSDSVQYGFNQKFLELMPNKLKECLNIYIQTHEDILEEKEIGKLVAHIKKRFKYVPVDILNIYTREIANNIRIDRETHEKQALKHFQRTFNTSSSADKPQTFPGFELQFLSTEDKLKMFAVEKAMADGFYKITKKENVYSKTFAQLLNLYDLSSTLGHSQQIFLNNELGEPIYTLKEKPDTKNLYLRYINCLNSIKSNENIIGENGQINKQELLQTLNKFGNKNLERDKYLMQKLDLYFANADEKKEVQKLVEINKTEPVIDNSQYKKDFNIELKRIINRFDILPYSYTRDLSNIILEAYPKNLIEEFIFTSSLKSKEDILNKITKTLPEKCSKESLQKLNQNRHALESAIAEELVSRGENADLYEKGVEELILLLEKHVANNNTHNQLKINKYNILELYNKYRKDLAPSELSNITNCYFVKSNSQNDKILRDYLNEYGKSCLILFSNNMSFSLKVKEAFNNKFLRLMPQSVKDVVKPLLQSKEDITADYNIEMVRRQLADRFSFIPSEPLKIYTNEAATIMRMARVPELDKEFKENYGIESFKRSLNSKIDDEDGVFVVKIPKFLIQSNSSKLKMLAIEQSMADELYRVSHDNTIYKYELEDLALWFSFSSDMQKDSKGVNISGEDDNVTLHIKSKANPYNLIQKYIKYVKEFESSENLYLPNGELNREELLYFLNSKENMPEREKYIKERIDKYFAD